MNGTVDDGMGWMAWAGLVTVSEETVWLAVLRYQVRVYHNR